MENPSSGVDVHGPCLVCNKETEQLCPICSRFICSHHADRHVVIHGPVMLGTTETQTHVRHKIAAILSGIAGAFS